MRTNIYTTAVALSDADLLARTLAIAAREHEATAELVAHLAVLEMRPSAYAAVGQGSLFGYCTEVLRLSEDAACTRIAAARWCRAFPVIADLMAAGALSLTAVRLLGPHLTPGNHVTVLGRASNRPCKEVEILVAELAPQPDLVASVRKLPTPRATREAIVASSAPSVLWDALAETQPGTPATDAGAAPVALATDAAVEPTEHEPIGPSPVATCSVDTQASVVARPSAEAPKPRLQRAVVKASAPERYRVQFTMGQGAHDELRRVQALLRREIPSGDAGLIFERALHLLRVTVEKEKLGAGAQRAQRSSPKRMRQRIRLETDNTSPEVRPHTPQDDEDPQAEVRTAGADRASRSRHISSAVRTAVWKRDAAQCAFVTSSGSRCSERSYLEFHHVQPFARLGPPTVANISLRCRRHNQYEAELVFGSRDRSSMNESPHG